MPREIKIVVKDVRRTHWMQTFGVFESRKFFGDVLTATQTGPPARRGAAATLVRFRKLIDTSDRQVVGVIVPGRDAAILAGHDAVSNCRRWATVADICRGCDSRLSLVEG